MVIPWEYRASISLDASLVCCLAFDVLCFGTAIYKHLLQSVIYSLICVKEFFQDGEAGVDLFSVAAAVAFVEVFAAFRTESAAVLSAKIPCRKPEEQQLPGRPVKLYRGIGDRNGVVVVFADIVFQSRIFLKIKCYLPMKLFKAPCAPGFEVPPPPEA